jgi:transcriptional regulator with XRE-family HTH domain
MSEQKFTDEPCPRCGSAQRVVNGAWLRERRTRAGLSLRDVGARLGYSAVYLSDIERGRRNALPRIVKVYEAL